jgi:isopenicillin N synthase-like dioxygenase
VTTYPADTPVPVIDIGDALAGDPDARRRTAASLDLAAQDSGFFVITGHGVPDDVIDNALTTSREFFARSIDEKNRFTTDRSYRGYLAMNDTALAKTLGDDSPPDLSESFNVGRYDEMPDVGDDPAVVAMCHPNLWPDEPAGMRSAFGRYFEHLDALSAELLRLLAVAAGVDEETYVSRNEYANSTMMLVNYYPAVDFTPPPGQLRRGAHSDYGTITLLYAETEPGLQIRHGGKWRDIPAVDGGFVVNIGDLLSAWVDGRWTSTLHRVLVPEGRADRDRVSIPFFVHPDYFTEIPVAGSDEPVHAGEWIAAKSQSMMSDD